MSTQQAKPDARPTRGSAVRLLVARVTGAELAPSDLALIASFTALICVLAMPGGFSLVGSAPITLQTLGFMLAASILGAVRGAATVGLYVILIAVGLPVAAGGRGGIEVITGVTGGYLLGGIAGAFVTGLILDLIGRRRLFRRSKLVACLVVFAANIIGLVGVVYAIGVPWYAHRVSDDLLAVLSSMGQFLPGDIAKAVIAALVTWTIAKAYPRIFREG